MRILHLADLHLGKKLNGYDLTEDQEEALNQIAMIAKEAKKSPEGLDLIALCGDIYQSSMPSGASLHVMTAFLEKLMPLNVPIFMLSGNHDSDARISYLSPLLSQANVFVTTSFDGKLQTRTIADAEKAQAQMHAQVNERSEEKVQSYEGTGVDVHMLPFIKPIQVKDFFPDEEITTYEDAVGAVIRHSDIDPDKINIFLGHQCVTGSEEAGSEERIIGGSEDVGLKVFEPFDVVLLGHIHRPQTMKKENPLVSYAGSLLPYSAKEAGQVKTVSLITVNGKDEAPTIERIPYQIKRQVRQVEGYFDDLMLLRPTEDLVSVTLLDEYPPMDYVQSLRSVFRCLLEVKVKDITGALNIQSVDAEADDLEDKDDLSLFEEFYAFATGRELPEEGKALLKELFETEGEAT